MIGAMRWQKTKRERSMREEAKRILEVYRGRGLRAGSHIPQDDFGSAIVWKGGFVHEEATRRALVELFEGGYLIENSATFELTAEGDRAIYAGRRCLSGEVMAFLDDVGVELVEQYFDPKAGFSGRAFDTYAGGGDAVGNRNRFTSDDLVAVSMLEVYVPGEAALQILDDHAAEYSGLLAAIPCNLDLWEADAGVIGSSSPAATLWDCLCELHGVASVTAHKLMARKRPRLLPVYDSVVKAALQPSDHAFWAPLRLELDRDEIITRLYQMRMTSGLAENISLLRVLDVAVWMRNRRASTRRLPFAPCSHYGTF